MDNKAHRIDSELMARNCRAIGKHMEAAAKEASKAINDFAAACAKIDLEKMHDDRRHD